MKIIIAPAKKMKVDLDSFPIQGLPTYLTQTRQILAILQQMNFEELHTLWQCSEQLARTNYEQLQHLDLTTHLTPAILAYTGIQYQYMAPDLFTQPALDYVQANLRIMSGFYGLLRPFDGTTPYRLEMQAKLPVGDARNLYDFWGQQLHDDLYADDDVVIDLASKEYSRCVTRYLQPQQQLIEVVFGSLVEGRVKTRATLAKMARGEMVRYMAENQVTRLQELRKFDHLGYHFDEQRSTATQLVFIKATDD